MTLTSRPSARLALIIALLACLLAAVPPAFSQNNARDWLMRMATAVEKRNYEGTLVHMHSGQADVLRIVHRYENGRVSERITAVDGAGREIIRDGEEVTCILPDQKAVVIEPRDATDSSQSPLQGRLPRLDSLDERYYRLSIKRGDPIAGRKARMLRVRARDDFRYGYRLWLDEDTAMPLKTQLMQAEEDVIEEIQFSSIVIRASIPAQAVSPSVEMSGFNLQRALSAAPSSGAPPSGARSHWQATRMPPGFMLVASRGKLAPGASDPIEQLVYSDGLATVSVFVEKAPSGDDEGEGVSSMGAANAYTSRRDGYMITAVGDVPVPTVEMLSMSLRKRPGGF